MNLMRGASPSRCINSSSSVCLMSSCTDHLSAGGCLQYRQHSEAFYRDLTHLPADASKIRSTGSSNSAGHNLKGHSQITTSYTSVLISVKKYELQRQQIYYGNVNMLYREFISVKSLSNFEAVFTCKQRPLQGTESSRLFLK